MLWKAVVGPRPGRYNPCIMRLKVSHASAEERLTVRLNEGYELRQSLQADYNARQTAGTFDTATDMERYDKKASEWTTSVYRDLIDIFPTDLEGNFFCDRVASLSMQWSNMDQRFGDLYHQIVPGYIERLGKILEDHLARYTDLPLSDRLYVEDIDSFRKVRDVNPAQVAGMLDDGYFDRSEDSIQLALEQILDVSFHKKDWGGEINDLYTANMVVNGTRRATAFLLKGNGLKSKEMRIKDCGKNGDQIVRLFQSPADLYVVQFVGRISEMVIADVVGKVRDVRAQGRDACFLIMDGQDTARILQAYGKL